LQKKQDSEISLYRHYKNKDYQFLGHAFHSETLEELVLYKALYSNKLGPLWVRPKELFYGEIVLNQQKVPRFQKIDINFIYHEKINKEYFIEIEKNFNNFFENLSLEKVNSRLKDYPNFLLLTAHDQGQCVGFKLGYSLNDSVFYSWLGAVKESHQGLGIGKQLIKLQHQWCLNKEITEIRTKTLNHWKNMIHLNIDSGFIITGTKETDSGKIKILMTKKLN
jgi:GNAT superfamily N-acetyltransferase